MNHIIIKHDSPVWRLDWTEGEERRPKSRYYTGEFEDLLKRLDDMFLPWVKITAVK